jgi:hypothetical protein
MSTRGAKTKSQVRRWQQWSAEEAGRVLEEWRASGLALGRFARERGIGAERLRWWKKRLGDWSEKADGTKAAVLVPVVLSEPEPAVAAGKPPVVVRVPGGMVVEVAEPAAVSAQWLAQVVSQLSRARG